MPRHITFWVAVFCLILLSVVYPIRNASAQSDGDIAGVRAASKAFYDALAADDRGKAMAKVWAHTSYVTNLGPRSKSIVVGWEANSKYWKQTNNQFGSIKASLSGAQRHVNGNLAWEMGLETGEIKLNDGTVKKINYFATNVFEKIDGRWLMVSHHVQPMPQ